MKVFSVLLVALVTTVSAQPFAPNSGFLPTGNLRTSDEGGPYNLTLLPVQANEIKAAIAARDGNTDADFVDFLVNVECLEGLFDTWGTFGHGFFGNLELGGPTPEGAKKANLSPEVEQYLQEVALNEQGHALFTRHAGSSLPCPQVNFTAFDQYYAAVYGLDPTPSANSIAKKFGKAFDPFLSDETFTTSMLALEELGATGNKGLAGAIANPVISTGVAGLATSANSQATIQRILLWERRNNVVEPFAETVQQVMARISAFRDSLDGPQFDDQGLTNTDPRNIAVPDGFINLVSTDIHGITFNRTPKMLLNILFLGKYLNGKGSFFPNGIGGKINNPVGYDKVASGLTNFPYKAVVDGQETKKQVGTISPPLSPTNNPMFVEGSKQLSQDLGGPIANASYTSRGFVTIPTRNPLGIDASQATPVQVAIKTGPLPSTAQQICYRLGK